MPVICGLRKRHKSGHCLVLRIDGFWSAKVQRANVLILCALRDPFRFLCYLRAMERQPCRRSHRPLVRLKCGGIVSPGLRCDTHRDGRICDSGFVVWRSGNRSAFRPARVGLPDIFGESDVKLFGLQLSPMDSRCRDQDGLALLTDAGCLLGDCAQRLCLRTTKRYPASFGGRQGSHSAL